MQKIRYDYILFFILIMQIFYFLLTIQIKNTWLLDLTNNNTDRTS